LRDTSATPDPALVTADQPRNAVPRARGWPAGIATGMCGSPAHVHTAVTGGGGGIAGGGAAIMNAVVARGQE